MGHCYSKINTRRPTSEFWRRPSAGKRRHWSWDRYLRPAGPWQRKPPTRRSANNNRQHIINYVTFVNGLTGCLPIFEGQFKTCFKTFQDQLFWNLRPVCMTNDEQVLGNGSLAATQEISWLISDPIPGARIFFTTCNGIYPNNFVWPFMTSNQRIVKN